MNALSHRDWVLDALQQHEAPLRRYAARLLQSEERGRDVVQHAFLKLCEQSPASIRTTVRQWLYTVCRNRAFDLLRDRSSKRAVPAEQASDSDWRDALGREPDPAEIAENLELSDLLQRLVLLLPASQREAIDLWCGGLSHQEIAAILGRKEGAVRVLVHRGLNTLRTEPQVRAWLDSTATDRAPINSAAGR